MPNNPPSRAELLALVQAWRHEQQTHHRAAGGTHARDGAAERMRRIDGTFERVLRAWVVDERLRRAWRDALHHQAPFPLKPAAAPPLTFRGLGGNNSTIEVRPGADNLFDVRLDGGHVDRINGLDLDMRDGRTFLRFRTNTYEESSGASSEALRALRAWVGAPAGQPAPFAFARELAEDGLIDGHLALTPRGRRVLASARTPELV